MKKKSLLIAILMLIMSLSALTACVDKTVKHKVTFYDGTTVLFTVDVVDGEKITPGADGKIGDNALPSKTGKSFVDWYRTPSLTAAFDFSEAITEEKSVFAGFKGAYVNDTREFAVIGAGKGSVLYSSNWGASIGEGHILTKASSTTENKYSITLNLFQDDKFQIGVIAGLGTTQRGFGYLKEAVKGGVEYFENGGQHLGGDSTGRKADIIVKKDGKYTLTLTTNPADDTTDTANDNPNVNPWDTITWVRNGDTDEEPVSLSYDYFIKGNQISHWQNMLDPYHQLSVGIFNQKFTKSIFLKAGDEFMFIRRSVNLETGAVATSGGEVTKAHLNAASETYITKKDGNNNNMEAKAAGIYTFTIDLSKASGEQLSATFTASTFAADDYYLNGKFGAINWNTVSNTGFNPDYKLTETTQGSGIYKIDNITFAANDVFTVQAFVAGSTTPGASWVNQTATYNHLYTLASKFYDAENAGGKNYNIKISRAGAYNITLNAYSKQLALTPVETLPPDVYISGSMQPSWQHGFQEQWMFYDDGITENALVLYIELTLPETGNTDFGLAIFNAGAAAGNNIAFKSFANLLTSSSAYTNFTGAGSGGTSGNVRLVTAGTYKITYYYAGTNEGSFEISEHTGTIPARP